jgi:hypothetical protein
VRYNTFLFRNHLLVSLLQFVIEDGKHFVEHNKQNYHMSLGVNFSMSIDAVGGREITRMMIHTRLASSVAFLVFCFP